MKQTLLEMTQEILSSMDSDEVDSITDTVESMQVARVIRRAYFTLFSGAALPEHKGTFNLQASGDNAKPVLMTRPDTIQHIEWIKYNKATTTETYPQFKAIYPLKFTDFMEFTLSLNTEDTTVDSFTHTVDGHTATFIYTNNVAPNYYTSFNDNTLIFDSYDSTVDTTLQSAKTVGFGSTSKAFSLVDAFTPDLDEQQFDLLVNASKELAFAELKQVQHAVASKNVKLGKVTLSRAKRAVGPHSELAYLPNYGRK